VFEDGIEVTILFDEFERRLGAYAPDRFQIVAAKQDAEVGKLYFRSDNAG
jgi:hypothetical protein